MVWILFTLLALAGGYAALKFHAKDKHLLAGVLWVGTGFAGYTAFMAAIQSWLFWLLVVGGTAAVVAVKHKKLKKRIEKANPGALNSGQSVVGLAGDLYTGAKAAKKIRSERL